MKEDTGFSEVKIVKAVARAAHRPVDKNYYVVWEYRTFMYNTLVEEGGDEMDVAKRIREKIHKHSPEPMRSISVEFE